MSCHRKKLDVKCKLFVCLGLKHTSSKAQEHGGVSFLNGVNMVVYS